MSDGDGKGGDNPAGSTGGGATGGGAAGGGSTGGGGAGGVKTGTIPKDPFAVEVNALSRKWTAAANEVQSVALTSRTILVSDADEVDVNKFLGMFRSLEKYYSKCEQLMESIEDAFVNADKHAEFLSSKRPGQQSKIKDYYYEAQSAYENIKHKRATAEAAALAQQSHAQVGMPSFSFSGPTGFSNLPRINVPKFDGKYSNWPKFRDTFVSVIEKNANLSAMEKFHYLTSALSGNAATVISSFSLEEKNYKLAWTALEEVFENRRLLANSYMTQLLQFKANQGKPNVQSLLNFLSNVADNVAALKMLNIPQLSEFILFFLAFRCLDNQTKEQFELANKNVEFPTFDALIKHVRSKCLALQLTEGSFDFESTSNTNATTKPDNKGKSSKFSNAKPKTTLVASETKGENSKQNSTGKKQQVKCVICSELHSLLSCPSFYSLSPEERVKRLSNWQGCRNCLNNFHATENCKSKWHCRFCAQRHHALLHPSGVNSGIAARTPSTEPAANSSATSLHTSTSQENDQIEVILGTAWVNFVDSRGQHQRFRVVLDSGSCSSFITTRCVHRLGLSMKPTKKQVSSLGGSLFDGAKGIVSCILRSMDNCDLHTEAIVVKNITNHIPVQPVPYDIWKHYINFELADPKFWEPAPIDVLLGADLYGEIMKGGVTTIRDDLPKLFDSVFGLVVMGRYIEPSNHNASSPNLFSACLFSPAVPDDVSWDLSKFWELEELPECRPTLAPEEEQAERHFQQTHYRTTTGRYVVRLPFKIPDLEFPSSRYIARHRLINLESKLKSNPKLATQYHAFMKEYLDLGHMRITNEPSKFVIPHHCVSKIDRGEVKIRVVFDGSVSTAQGSLNQNLLAGYPLQRHISDILLNFRAHSVVFVTDAVKCYRQVSVDQQDRPYQHILWRFDPSEAVQTYELCTVTYGLKSSSFISLRIFKALAEDEGKDLPRAAEVLQRDLYVDDIATGANSVDSALELQRQVIEIMRRGGFELGKWASNRPELLAAVNITSNSTPDVSWHEKENTAIKVLGLKWEPTSDCFTYSLSLPATAISKRGILSTTARVYDPLGFVSPFVFLMKLFIQELWKLKLDWDDEIPEDLGTLWIELLGQLDVLAGVKIPRFVCSSRPFRYQVLGFSDASQKGYCAALYLRVEDEDGISSKLLTAKTKLAPLKSVSLPRLELCGAVLLVKLYNSIKGFLSLLPAPIKPAMYFTDSMIVLGWLQTPTYKLQTFVGNRIAYILRHTKSEQWNHVDGIDNPSDLGSRGCMPNHLVENTRWWNGPTWLTLDESEWPCHEYTPTTELCELKPSKPPTLIAFRPNLQECMKWMEKISSYENLIRSVAVLNQGMARFKNPSLRKGALHITTEEEYSSAEILCIKAVQCFYFFKGNKPTLAAIHQKYACLNPYLDASGILRVGGRLNKSELPDSQKHPILLPHEAHFSHILVDQYHEDNNHPGPNHQQALIQLRFSIPSLRRLIRHRSFYCIQCYKSKAKIAVPMMADLPAYRLQGGRSFLHVGCDFAGPFSVKESTRRKAPVSKAYLCLYVCMNTKALHLEMVSNMSAEAFLASFTRFISRRGLPSDMYSDCGTNFKGAARELQELAKWFAEEQTQDAIQHFSAPRGIKWHFNPPYSPHFGGLWEAGVKSVKRHLYLTAGKAILTSEELSTLFCKIEAILNSRPLCPLSSDPGEIAYLSPGHFLIGGNLLEPPEPSLLDVQENRLNRWQIVKQISQRIWHRWRVEYLSTLQARNKWRKPEENLKVGDLVIIRTADSPQLYWPMGRVIDVHPGTDGAVRVVTLRTSNGTYQRSAANLIPLLPLNERAQNE